MNYIKNIIQKCFEVYLFSKHNIDKGGSVYDIAKDLLYVKGVDNLILNNGKFNTFQNVEGKKVLYKDYKVLIETLYGNIEGYIRVCPNNEILLSLWESSINESFNLHESLLMKNFLVSLKNCESFKDIKDTLIKYSKEGIVAGAMLSAVFMSFNLDNALKKELISQTYASEIEHQRAISDLDYWKFNMNSDEYNGIVRDYEDEIEGESEDNYKSIKHKSISKKPIWKKLCNNTEVTVYNAVPSLCNANCNTTASGFKLNMNRPGDHKVVAMERTMMRLYGLHYGDLIKIEGTGKRDGVYQIQDTMNKRFAGKHKVDILVNNDIHLGKWNDIAIYKLENQDDVLNKLKTNMLDAKNQDKMDAKQYSNVHESFIYHKL